MEFKKFTENVLKEIREKAAGKFSAWTTEVVKNNGVRLTGITTVAKDSKSGPCVYLDGYYHEYKKGNREFGEILEDIYGQIIMHQEYALQITVSDFLQWETIREHIYPRLVNADMNRELLAEIPHRLFLDLAVVYCVRVDVSEDGFGSILIHYPHTEMWGQNEEILYQIAMENMCSKNETTFDSMENILKCFLKENAPYGGKDILEDTGMYVLTNRSRLFGASSILQPGILAEIAEGTKSNLIILPSSIHEVILIPAREDEIPDRGSFCKMICDVNKECLSDVEVLSDHPYFYNRVTAQITAA